jgi:hypothetical protein
MTQFNLGAIFHAAQLKWQDNGTIKESLITDLKAKVRPEWRKICRQTGTMSNTMTLDAPGYNHIPHDQQLKNQKKKQPTVSYWYAFVDFYHRMGFDGAYITLNCHSSYYGNGSIQSEIIDVLAFLRIHKINIVAIELGNEDYLYPQITGMQGGSPSFTERLRIGSNTKIEQWVSANVFAYNQHLKKIAVVVRELLPGVPIGVAIANPTQLRDKAYNAAMLSDRFYDFVAPHIYITDASVKGVLTAVTNHLVALPKDLDKRVTEYTWNYQAQPKGHPLSNDALIGFFEQAFKANGVKDYFFHNMTNGIDANGYVKF